MIGPLRIKRVMAATMPGAAFLMATLVSASVSSAQGPKAPDTWTVTLQAPDLDSADGKAWHVTTFDAVTCKDLDTFSLQKNEKKKLKIQARANAGSATKGELGAHFRWAASGKVPMSDKDEMWWWGDPKIGANRATVTMVFSLKTGTGQMPKITGDCDK